MGIPEYDAVADGQGVRVGRRGGAALSVAPFSRTYANDDALGEAFGRLMPVELADLIDVGMSVYFTDRLARRNDGLAGSGWGRRLNLKVGVREPSYWEATEVGGGLADLLSLLTGDSWTLTFEKLRAGRERQLRQQGSLFQSSLTTSSSVVLFSGGLDSFAGLSRIARERSTEDLLAVSVRSTSRLSAPQKLLVSSVAAGKRDLKHLSVHLGFKRRARRAYNRDEPSQRTRAFVYYLLGASSAAIGGRDEVVLCEPGIGAINLPYVDSQLGAQANRGSRPEIVAAIGRWLAKAMRRPMRIVAPHFLLTKAELAKQLAHPETLSVLGSTVSCDGFPQRISGTPQCGRCLSCILRRQALYSAGLREVDAKSKSYRYDLFDRRNNKNDAGYFLLRAMHGQVHRIAQCLRAYDPWGALSVRYPGVLDARDALGDVVPGGVNDPELQLLGLFGRYVAEWSEFAEAVGLPAEQALAPDPDDE